jgi:hypothetical protein
MPVRIPLSFDTPAGWGTVRPNDNFAAWAQAMAEARAGSGLGRKKRLERLQTYWTAVAAALYTPAFPYSYRAMVLIPRDGDGKVTTIAHLSRYEELLSFAYEGIVLDGAEGATARARSPPSSRKPAARRSRRPLASRPSASAPLPGPTAGSSGSSATTGGSPTRAPPSSCVPTSRTSSTPTGRCPRSTPSPPPRPGWPTPRAPWGRRRSPPPLPRSEP